MVRAGVVALGLAALGACGGKPPPPPPAPRAPAHVTPAAAPAPPANDDDDDSGAGEVRVIGGRGHMNQAAVEAGIAPHAAELSRCYMARASRRHWLGGHVVIHWDIRRDGTITKVRLAESNLGSWPVEKCLLEVARSATFAKPVGGDADFTLPLDFSATRATLPWNDDQALRAVGGQLRELDRCAKRWRRPDDVTITVYVGSHGKAKSVGFASDKSVIADAWAKCAQKTALKWRLPDPRGVIAKLAIRYRAGR